LVTARWYERRGERISAVAIYRRLIRDFSDTAAAQVGLRQLEAWDVPLVDPRDPAPGPGQENRDQAPDIDVEITPNLP